MSRTSDEIKKEAERLHFSNLDIEWNQIAVQELILEVLLDIRNLTYSVHALGGKSFDRMIDEMREKAKTDENSPGQ